MPRRKWFTLFLLALMAFVGLSWLFIGDDIQAFIKHYNHKHHKRVKRTPNASKSSLTKHHSSNNHIQGQVQHGTKKMQYHKQRGEINTHNTANTRNSKRGIIKQVNAVNSRKLKQRSSTGSSGGNGNTGSTNGNVNRNSNGENNGYYEPLPKDYKFDKPSGPAVTLQTDEKVESGRVKYGG